EAVGDVDAHAITLPKAQPRPGHLPVEGKRADIDARKNAPADYRGLEVEYLDAAFDSRRKLAVAARFEAILRGVVARMHGRHIPHRRCRRIAVHNHSGGHDAPAYVAHAEPKVDPIGGGDHADQ